MVVPEQGRLKKCIATNWNPEIGRFDFDFRKQEREKGEKGGLLHRTDKHHTEPLTTHPTLM